MIYLTSDLHFSHNKPFIYKPRGFNSVLEMNNAIIKNWNNTIRHDDDVYILGDIMLNDDKEGIKCLSQLNGRLHIITGNHDTDNRNLLYANCHNVIEATKCARNFKYEKYHFYLSHYPTLTSNYDTDKPLKARLINLCGHLHTKDKFIDMNKGLIYHVELDAHNNRPVAIDEIISDIKKYLKLDK